jgi:hypothetical protein
MAAITEHEANEIDEANASERPPVVFTHGLWLPDDPDTVGEANEHPEVFAPQDGGAGCRSLRRCDPPPHGQAGRDRTLLRRPAHPDPRRTWPGHGVCRDRSGSVPRPRPTSTPAGVVSRPTCKCDAGYLSRSGTERGGRDHGVSSLLSSCLSSNSDPAGRVRRRPRVELSRGRRLNTSGLGANRCRGPSGLCREGATVGPSRPRLADPDRDRPCPR